MWSKLFSSAGILAISLSMAMVPPEAHALTKTSKVALILASAGIGTALLCSALSKSNPRAQQHDFQAIADQVALQERIPSSTLTTAPAIVKTSTALLPGLSCLDNNKVTEKALYVYAMKNQLMEIGLLCNRTDDYNSFVLKFRPSLVQAEGTLTSFFAARFAASSQTKEDRFKTEMANQQSEQANLQGSNFCINQSSLMKAALEASDIFVFSQTYRQSLVELCN